MASPAVLFAVHPFEMELLSTTSGTSTTPGTNARLRAERIERSRHQHEMERRLKAQGPKVDDGFEKATEVMAARAAIAADSRAQHREQNSERRRQNVEIRRKLQHVRPLTDDKIDEVAAAQYRAQLAAESRERAEDAAAEQKRWNRHLHNRVQAAVDEDGVDEEKERFRQLVEGHELTRPSVVPESELRLLRSYNKNKQLADDVRKNKEEWRLQRGLQDQEHLAKGQRNFARRRNQQKTVHALHDEIFQERATLGQQQKAEQKEGEARTAKQQQKMLRLAQKRYQVARAVDSKLDAQEEAAAAAVRVESSQMRAELTGAWKELRTSEFAARKEQAAAIRASNRQGLQATKELVASEIAQRGQTTREETKQGRDFRVAEMDTYLEQARRNKERSAAIRKAIRAKSLAVKHRKKQQADSVRERVAEGLQFGSAYDGMAAKKTEVRTVYAHRYGHAEEAAGWAGSPLHKIHAWSRWAIDGLGDSLNWTQQPKVVSRRPAEKASPVEAESPLQTLLRMSRLE